jgi:glycosyltransferase involved in cell wall biosynthesis
MKPAKSMKVLIASDLSAYALAHSYVRALACLGLEHRAMDVARAATKFVRAGRLGQVVHRFLPVEAWNRKANREFAVACIDYDPDVLIVFGNAPVLFGTLALIKSACRARIVLYWPDTLLNLSQDQLNGASLYDCVATYSAATRATFETMGFRNPLWLPFGADPEFLGKSGNSNPEFRYDISFAGGWRPERESALRAIRRHCPNGRLAIFGRTWLASCKDPDLRRHCCAHEPVGHEYGNLMRESRIALNPIDDTNYPAANMRFFEIPAAGGLQLSSTCPEMREDFRGGEHLLYYDNDEELAARIDWILARPAEAAAIRREGHRRAIEGHTYMQRINTLRDHLGLAS